MSERAAGSKYTVETGPGYLGVWQSYPSMVEISIGTYAQFPWRSDDTIHVVEDTTGEEIIADAVVFKQGVGTAVRVSRDALDRLDGFEPGVDIRAYDRDAGGFRLVTKAADPFVDGGGDDV